MLKFDTPFRGKMIVEDSNSLAISLFFYLPKMKFDEKGAIPYGSFFMPSPHKNIPRGYIKNEPRGLQKQTDLPHET